LPEGWRVLPARSRSATARIAILAGSCSALAQAVVAMSSRVASVPPVVANDRFDAGEFVSFTLVAKRRGEVAVAGQVPQLGGTALECGDVPVGVGDVVAVRAAVVQVGCPPVVRGMGAVPVEIGGWPADLLAAGQLLLIGGDALEPAEPFLVGVLVGETRSRRCLMAQSDIGTV
jgi:hypothetical protein